MLKILNAVSNPYNGIHTHPSIHQTFCAHFTYNYLNYQPFIFDSCKQLFKALLDHPPTKLIWLFKFNMNKVVCATTVSKNEWK